MSVSGFTTLTTVEQAMRDAWRDEVKGKAADVVFVCVMGAVNPAKARKANGKREQVHFELKKRCDFAIDFSRET